MNFLLFENKKRIQFGTRTRLEKLENIIKNLSPPSSINLLGNQVLNAIINQNDFRFFLFPISCVHYFISVNKQNGMF